MNCALLYCELLDRALQTSATHRARSSLKTWKFQEKQRTIHCFIPSVMNFIQKSVDFCLDSELLL